MVPKLLSMVLLKMNKLRDKINNLPLQLVVTGCIDEYSSGLRLSLDVLLCFEVGVRRYAFA